jgi:hypothetical protein
METIQLTKGYSTIVDDEDFEFLNQWKWHAIKIGNTLYANRCVRKGKQFERIAMHRLIMNPPDNMVIDHIDHNGLNNQKSNLRICSVSQNTCNSRLTGEIHYKGVSKRSSKQKHVLKNGEIVEYNNSPAYKSWIRINGVLTYLGKFNTPEDAALAYNKAAIKYHKEFANLNII